MGSWGAERGKWTSVHFYFAQKGGETVETSSFRQAVEAQFDCLSKKVIKRAVMKGYRDMKRREKRECSFSDLPDYQQDALASVISTKATTPCLTCWELKYGLKMTS